MYLHMGGDYIVNRRDIIGVFDIDNSTVSNITKEYLRKKEKEGRVLAIGKNMPKSFIIIEKSDDIFIYISSLSPYTLKKRFGG